MAQKLLPDRRNKFIAELDFNEQVQLNWIKGIKEQVDFANRRDVLPDYFLHLKVTRRRYQQ